MRLPVDPGGPKIGVWIWVRSGPSPSIKQIFLRDLLNGNLEITTFI